MEGARKSWLPVVGNFNEGINFLRFYRFNKVNVKDKHSYVFTFVKYNKNNSYPSFDQIKQDGNVDYIVYYIHKVERAFDYTINDWTSDPKNPFFIREIKRQISAFIELVEGIVHYSLIHVKRYDDSNGLLLAKNIVYNACAYITSKINRLKFLLESNRFMSNEVTSFLDKNEEFVIHLSTLTQFAVDGFKDRVSESSLSVFNAPIVFYFDKHHSQSFLKRYDGKEFNYPPFNPSYGSSIPILTFDEMVEVGKLFAKGTGLTTKSFDSKTVTTKYVYVGDVLVNVIKHYHIGNGNGNNNASSRAASHTPSRSAQQIKSSKVVTKSELVSRFAKKNPAFKEMVDSNKFELINPDEPVVIEEDSDDVPF